jgi:hypothetical protein
LCNGKPITRFSNWTIPIFGIAKINCSAVPSARATIFLCDELDARTEAVAVRRIADLLPEQHPLHFQLETGAGSKTALHCGLTGETLSFDRHERLQNNASYFDALDALACQVQEDLAVIRRSPERGDWIAALHVCAPSHWAPADKIGRSFDETHAPVPGMERTRRVSSGLIDALIRGRPTVRFTAGIEFDDHLNHNPNITRQGGDTRIFDQEGTPPFTLRVERQVLVGIPEADAALFTIRVYLCDGAALCADPAKRGALVAALRSMSPESRAFKSLGSAYADLLHYLEGG